MLGGLGYTLWPVEFGDRRQKRFQFLFRFREQTGVFRTRNGVWFKDLLDTHHFGSPLTPANHLGLGSSKNGYHCGRISKPAAS
jgi:hypothetical protein